MEQDLFISGIFSIFCVLTATILGLTIMSRYLKYNNPQLIAFGLFWILLFSPWWASSIAFILLLLTNRGLSSSIYFNIAMSPTIIAVIIWIALFTKLKNMKLRKFIISINILIGIFFEVYLIYFSFTDPSIIGTVDANGIDGSTKGMITIYAIYAIITYFSTGVLFGKELHKSNDPEMKLKGKFIIIAVVFFVSGAVMDVLLPLNIVIVAIGRIILILSAFLFYFGIILPNFIKKMFLKI